MAAKVRSLKEYGWDKKRNTVNIGINSRLDELHASILNVKLKYLDRDNTERQKIAQIYNSEIVNKKIIKPLSDNNINHVYHLYVIRTNQRNKLLKILKDNKIICGIHYKLPVHRQEVFKKFNKSSLKITEKISKQIISLPIYPGLKYKEQKKVINVLNSFKDF